MGRFFLKTALQRTANKALHLTAIPLRFIAAGELRRYEERKEEKNAILRKIRTRL